MQGREVGMQAVKWQGTREDEQGWRASRQINQEAEAGKKGWQERQGRADNQSGWVGEQNGQQAVRQGSREADKLARNGRHEHQIQYVCKAGRAGEARRQGPKGMARQADKVNKTSGQAGRYVWQAGTQGRHAGRHSKAERQEGR